MNPPNSNLRGFNLALSTLLRNPAQFIPHLTISTFEDLPEGNLGSYLDYASPPPPPPHSTTATTTTTTATGQNEKHPPIKQPQIRALAIDKDNTLSPPQTTHISDAIYTKLHTLRTTSFRAPNSLLIVSNRAGSHSRYDHEITALEARLAGLDIPVFRLPAGCAKKPFCGEEVVKWFRERGVVDGPGEIAVVGDRLGTDTLMAGRMGSWSIWCRDGAQGSQRNVLERMEAWVEGFLRVNCGLKPPPPTGFK